MSATNRHDPNESRPALRLIESDVEHALSLGPPLQLTVRPGEDLDGVGLIVAAGEIDTDGAVRLRTAITALMARRRYVVVDLDEATCADATVLPKLIDATCAETTTDVTLLFTDDPRCLLMLKIAGPAI